MIIVMLDTVKLASELAISNKIKEITNFETLNDVISNGEKIETSNEIVYFKK